MPSKTISFRLQDPAWFDEIKAAIEGSRAYGKGDVATVSDWLNRLIAVELNRRQRSQRRHETHVYRPGDYRNGRPAAEP